jgi:hypothetical protein
MIEKLKQLEDGTFEDDGGCNWDSRAEYLFMGVLPSCGCGTPSDIGRYVRGMLLKHVGYPSTKFVLGEGRKEWNENGYEDFPLMFFLSWATQEGYIEHGTTVRCSWLTSKGEELLRDLEQELGG